MIRYFASHPTAANLLMLVFISLGLFSLPRVLRETFPDYSPTEVEVRVVYPGATALEVEEAICQRIEDAVDGVLYIEEVLSEAREGVGIVTVEMQEDGNVQKFIDDIQTEVSAIDDFPEQAEIPLVRQLHTTDPVIAIAISGPMSAEDLKAYCEEIKDLLQIEEGISLVDIKGFSDHQIRIEVPAETLQQFKLSSADIAALISKQSLDLPSGILETSESNVLVRFSDERTTVPELENLVLLGGESGGEIRLGEIATITDLFELDEEKIEFNGSRAGVLQVSKNKNEDTLNISDAVKRFIEKERTVAPPGVQYTLTEDSSSIVRDRLQMLVKNGWQGLLLVVGVMWLFFPFRFSFWVAMGLPVSFLGAFFFFPQMGLSVNMITMVGLLVALGLLMDDAIVIAENIATHLAKGEGPLKAVVDGVSEVKMGVISSFVTTVCMFGPLSFLSGKIGKVLEVMPAALILVLSVSLIEAFFILPHHLGHAVSKEAKEESKFRQRFNKGMEWVTESLLGSTVDFCVRWRYPVLGVVFMFFLISVSMLTGGALKFQAFPQIDGDVIECRILLPQSAPLAKTEEVVSRVVTALERVNEEFREDQIDDQDLVKNVNIQYNKNIDAFEQGPHVATVSVDLMTAEERNARIDDIFSAWRREVGRVPDVIGLTFTEPSFGPAGRPIEIRLHGRDLAILESASHKLQTWLASFKGVFDITNDLRPGKPEIRVRLREGARSAGLTADEIAHQMRAALTGQIASEIQVGEEGYEIDIRLPLEDRNSIADLEYFHVNLPNGKQAPIRSVTYLEVDRSYARIARVNGRRTVTVLADVDPRITNTFELIEKFQEEVLPALKREHPGLAVSYEGEIQESEITERSLKMGFAIGILGMFILLSFQFHSYLEPITVMLAIPLSFIGVIGGHLLMGLDLSLPSTLGFVSLAGIVVNDSILLVHFVKIHNRAGASVVEAATAASRDRFRAVLLTSLTTIAGLIPLLSEKSLQAQILIPLATSLVFGLLASTVLVLLVIPALYSIFGDLRIIRTREISEAIHSNNDVYNS